MVAVTIRGVPDEVRDELAAVNAAQKPTVSEVLARARARVAVTGVRLDPAVTVEAKDADRR